ASSRPQPSSGRPPPSARPRPSRRCGGESCRAASLPPSLFADEATIVRAATPPHRRNRPSSSATGEQATSTRLDDRRAAAARAQLAHDRRDVVVDGADRDHELLGDVAVADALGYELENLALPAGQVIRLIRQKDDELAHLDDVVHRDLSARGMLANRLGAGGSVVAYGSDAAVRLCQDVAPDPAHIAHLRRLLERPCG